ncbi:O-antigen ligase family protein [Salibacteraceae bacterium]|nr:O-antigen ligase family protein [Salibacteraceae bacterium]
MWRKWLDPIETGLLIILAGFVFLPNASLPLILIALIAIRIIREPKQLIPNRNTLFLMIPAAITVLSWVSTGFASSGWKEVELWGIALGVFLYMQNRADKKLHIFQMSFIVWSLLQALLLLTFFALTDPFGSGAFSQHVRDSIEHTFHIHPTYITTAWSWALLLFWIKSNLKLTHKLSIAILFLLMIALTGGKMPLLALVICSIIYVARQSSIPLKIRLSLLASIPIFATLISITPVMQERFAEISSIELDYQEGQMLTSTELRLGVWKCSIESIMDNLWTGVGIGNTRETLEHCFEKYQQVEFFEGEYNTHSEWMHYWLASGFFGVLILALFFGYLIRSAGKSKRELLLYFLLFFILISMTENYFSRQIGVMLWAFFVAEWTQKQNALLNKV